MSKLMNIYNNLKHENSEILYLFKSGIFYIFLDEDAKKISPILNLKLTYFTDDILKCGFPANSLEKYIELLKKTSFEFKIIDTAHSSSYTIDNYCIDEKVKKLLLKIANVDTENISIKEAYSLLDDFKQDAEKITLKF